MKYCLSSRQQKQYLDKADEILVKEQDYRSAIDFFIDYSDKVVYLEYGKAAQEAGETWIKDLNKAAKGNLILLLDKLDVEQLQWFAANGIKYSYKYPVSTWYDVKGLVELGAHSIAIMAPLTFEMRIVQDYKASHPDLEFRAVPNVAYSAYIPREHGRYGQYIRPQDVQYYEQGIDSLWFEDCNLEKERALYRIYAEREEWDGNINFLITNLNINADNRIFPEDFGQIRANCGQKCMKGYSCHYCDSSYAFEQTIRKAIEQRKAQKKAEAEAAANTSV